LAGSSIEHAFVAIPDSHYIEDHRANLGASSTKGLNDVDA